MGNIELEESETFSFAAKTDLYAISPRVNVQGIVSLCSENQFRGIAVNLDNLSELVKTINKPFFGDKDIVPIALIDPLGNQSSDIRNYQIISAKEKNAKEVEVSAPYNLIYKSLHYPKKERTKYFAQISDDLRSLQTTVDRFQLSMSYHLNLNSPDLDNSMISKLCKILNLAKIDKLILSFGKDSSDNVIKMRNIKSATNCKIKAFLPDPSVEELATMVRAGIDFVGTNWNTATDLIMSYEGLINGFTE